MIDLLKIRHFLKENNLDAVVIMDQVTAALLKNLWFEDHMTALRFEDHPTLPVFPLSSDPFIVEYMSVEPPDEIKPPWFKEYYKGRGRGFYGLEQNLSVLARAMKERGLSDGKIGLDLDFVPVNTFKMLQKMIPNAEFKDASTLARQLRAVKRPKEIGFIKSAIHGLEAGYQKMLEEAREGVTLQSLGRLFQKVVVDYGCKYGWCTPIDVAKEWFDKEMPTSISPLWKKEWVLKKDDESEAFMYLGCRYQGYWAVMAGAFYLGTPPEEIAECYDMFLRWFEIAVEEIEPGMTTGEVYIALHEALKKEFGFAFGTIHGVGLTPHEDPYVDFGRTIEQHDERIKFEQNTVICFQPLIGNTCTPTKEGAPVGCIQDMYLMTKEGLKRLSTWPQKLIVI